MVLSSEPAVLAALATRIRDELVDLDAVVQRALDAWPLALQSPYQAAHTDSVALNLHGFYSGIERLPELVARHVDRTTPAGGTWHRELLDQMSREVPGIRPATLRAECAAQLDEFRRFRHIVRNLYAMHLHAERMAPLMSALPGLWSEARADLMAFAAFLEDLAQRRLEQAGH